jgi:Fe2+ or Zn2+ uptake regulation protein
VVKRKKVSHKKMTPISHAILSQSIVVGYNQNMQTIRTSNILAAAGLTPTKARLQVLNECIKMSKPATVTDVAAKVGSSAHLATVYRILEKLVTNNILHRVDFHEGKFRYEFVHAHHHHIVCDECGDIAEIHDDKIESLVTQAGKKSGYLMTNHTIELFGLCKECQRIPQHVK